MLGTVIQNLVNQTITRIVDFENSIEILINKFKNKSPSNEEIFQTINKKNQISKLLNKAKDNLNKINNTNEALSNILSTLNITINVIRNLPIPTSVPPGIGIPVSIIMGFVNTLTVLGKMVEGGETSSSQTLKSIEIILNLFEKLNKKLEELEFQVIDNLKQQTENLTDLEREEFFREIGINIKEKDPVSQKQLNKPDLFPVIHKNFRIIVKDDPLNKFDFPRRRAIASNLNTGVKIFGPYSYSLNIEVLIDNLKLEIDSKF